MMKSFSKILILFTLVGFASCDYVDDPVQESVDNGGNDETQLRDVLIMDFTGHKCQNCPKATREAVSIHDDYPEQVFVLGVHPNDPTYNNVSQGEPGEPFTTNFTTDLGIALYIQYQIPGMPFGVVNGIQDEDDGSWYLSLEDWRPQVEEIINQPKVAEIDIDLDYNSSSRNLGIETTTTAIEEWNGLYSLVVVLAEDSIVDWQKNGSPGNPNDDNYAGGEIPDYVHRHVLRGSVNGTQGTPLVTTDEITPPETTFEESFSTSLNVEFDESHVYVYAYVYNTNSLEIIDVSGAKVID